MKTKIKIARSESFVFNEIEGEIVMMNIETGAYASLNETGKSIWELLETPKTFEELIESLMEEYDVTEEQCKISVSSFLDKMKHANAIIPLKE
jgi:hypothetical protein